MKTGLAGGLASYQLVDRNGNRVAASQIDYNGQPAGYTADPREVINYIEAHDNDTLWDAIQAKAAPADTVEDRVRMQNLGISLLGFGQGIPFYHAGVELLRSKSLDRNSYNSGDWFNKLDFTYASNNWGVGLPPAPDNQANWPIQGPLLANPALQAGSPQILKAYAHFLETLAIRRSSPLFRLRTAADVQSHLRFYNTGPTQTPGLLVMSLQDDAGHDRPRPQEGRGGLQRHQDHPDLQPRGLPGREDDAASVAEDLGGPDRAGVELQQLARGVLGAGADGGGVLGWSVGFRKAIKRSAKAAIRRTAAIPTCLRHDSSFLTSCFLLNTIEEKAQFHPGDKRCHSRRAEGSFPSRSLSWSACSLSWRRQ